MNEASETSRVVNLSQRLDSASERGGELLNAVRTIAAKRLQQWVGNTFEHVDDALFDLAEKAENNATQMHYFDGMREVRKRRPVIERNFLGKISREIGELSQPRQQQANSTASTPSAGAMELSLVADNELEESLAITSMISKNDARLARDLFAVNQRLSVICGGHKIDDVNNPVAPAILSQTFRHALDELGADMRVKLIIYKLFDRYVLSALEELYQEINAELARAGVLPQLRHEVLRSASPRKGSNGTLTEDGSAADSTEDTGDIPSDLLQTLHALFSARRGSGGTVSEGSPSMGGGAPLPSANELLGALSVLQSQIVSAGPLQYAQSDDALALSREVLQLKGQLLNQIGALRGERPSHVANIDEDTIDLVGMLFEFILEDRNLPPTMQVMLARLQIPYLKAAILDRKLFAHRQHPARRLLDSLAEQAKSWSEESDRDHRLHEKVKYIVDQLLHEFDDDMGIFERLLTDLQQFQDINKRRSEVAEQRVAESTRGREKLEQARRRAAREILDRIGTQTLPPLLHGVLARAWANHLVLTLLRQGESSSEYRNALHFVDDFIISAQPAADDVSRQVLQQLIPGIERSLRLGLANVAFQEQDIDRVVAQLHTYYRQQLGENLDESEQVAVDEDAAMLAIPDNIQPIVDEQPTMDEIAEEELVEVPPDSPQWQQVQALQPGTWLEFSLPDEPMTRAKLSWISPMSGRYLFVNRRGLKVADYEPQQLAVLFIHEQARVLAANALFDRAMSAIVGRLRQPDDTPMPPTDTE